MQVDIVFTGHLPNIALIEPTARRGLRSTTVAIETALNGMFPYQSGHSLRLYTVMEQNF
jgi:hypothetical protein